MVEYQGLAKMSFFGIVVRWLKLKETWSEELVCVRCGVLFTELSNIGKWECSFHPGKKTRGAQNHSIRTSAAWVQTPEYRWSCCGKLWSSNHDAGCVSCDHSNKRFVMDKSDTVPKVHKNWLRELRPLPEAIEENPEDNDWVSIKRLQ